MPIRDAEDPEIRSMKGIHLYHFFLSNCAQRVALALGEKDLDFVAHSINLLARANTRDAYFRTNPAGLVPALVHDGVVITESIDILRYLEEQFPDSPLYPTDPTERRRVDGSMDEATENHNGVIKTYMYAVALGGKKSSEEMQNYLEKQTADTGAAEFHQRATAGFSEEEVLEAETSLFAFLDRIESELSEHRWLVGDDYSFADIAWFVQYFLMSRTGVIDFRNYPKIRNWASEVMKRPAFERGVGRLQPWYAPITCTVLKLKSRGQRGGPPPYAARVALASS
ncbi:MAG: glutathione S-transferase family protein [Myxococcota bacterium]|nr:glutathione S-transferase family protein [Myxococcota bacterium]